MDLPVIMRTHELYQSVSLLTEKLPSLKRQTIGRRIEDKTLELLAVLIMVKNTEIGRMLGGWRKSVQ
jgi:hypothetical protein